jgi:hypothetical protein
MSILRAFGLPSSWAGWVSRLFKISGLRLGQWASRMLTGR